jgi:sterol desaturase/sphingolipid hydroxylase (fatty acid hydroxylase superfamily)
MEDWLLAHQASLRTGVLFAIVVVVLVWETWLPRRAFAVPPGARWFNQIALTVIGTLALRLIIPFVAFSLAVWAQRDGFGLLNVIALPPWLALLVGILAIDLGMYTQHRLLHAVPFLWRFHQIHHCDLDVDCGTALRHHPVEMVITQAVDLALIAAVGVPPLAVVVGFTLTSVASLFNHGNIAMPHRGDRLLRWLVVTPDMHRIHHSIDVGESNRNFANLLTLWDHLFSTYRHEPMVGQTQMALGLAEARAERDFSLWKLLALPFRRRDPAAYAEIRLDQSGPSHSPLQT